MSFWVNTKRVFRSGFVSFWRNSVVSIASVLIMTVTLFTLGLLLFMGALLQGFLEQIQEKVDINIYFTAEAPEDGILSLKGEIENLAEVASVIYISREDALLNFRARHKDDYLTLQALDELGGNPLGATLGVKAQETSQYESIAKYLNGRADLSEGAGAIIDKINYEQNKVAIERLTDIVDGAQKLGLAVTMFLIAVSIVITFNTIRLAIYTAREEISVMRLVGASNWYTRGPFLVEGIMYGIFSAIVALILFYPATLWLGKVTEKFFGGMDLFSYYTSNFGEVFLIVVGGGILLGALSSFLAVRKYLKI
ncbi:MAG: permease-like cell division protein FtsX [Patescibacteria group bacterium]